MKNRLLSNVQRAAVIAALLFTSAVHAGDKPKLILQVTVDQLRGDLPTRYYDRLGEGGFRYFLVAFDFLFSISYALELAFFESTQYFLLFRIKFTHQSHLHTAWLPFD